MKSPLLLVFALISFSLTLGCGSSSSPTGGTGGSVGTGGGGGAVTYTLTVQNYLNWCDITENGTVYPASVPPVMSFAPGTVVDLNAVAGSLFVWGYWTGTDGDTSATHDQNMTTTVTMTANKTILACCPDPPPASQTCP